MSRLLRLTAALLLGVAAPGCVDGESFHDAILAGGATTFACDVQTASDGFAPTDGEGTVHPAPFSPSSPEVVARGADVTVTVVLDGARPELSARGEGGVEVLDASPTYCNAGDDSGVAAASTTHWVVALHVADRGDVVLRHDRTPVTRWTPEVRDAAELSLVLDDPGACTVGATCLVRAELLDAAGEPLYAEENFAWSVDGAADVGTFGSWLQVRPTGSGPLTIAASVLGHEAQLEIGIATEPTAG